MSCWSVSLLGKENLIFDNFVELAIRILKAFSRLNKVLGWARVLESMSSLL